MTAVQNCPDEYVGVEGAGDERKDRDVLDATNVAKRHWNRLQAEAKRGGSTEYQSDKPIVYRVWSTTAQAERHRRSMGGLCARQEGPLAT